jgi:hypothetical protein
MHTIVLFPLPPLPQMHNFIHSPPLSEKKQKSHILIKTAFADPLAKRIFER